MMKYRRWESTPIVRKYYGDRVHGVLLENMSEYALSQIAVYLESRYDDNVYCIEQGVATGIVQSSSKRKYYYNERGQLCITNDAGEEEVVDDDSLDEE